MAESQANEASVVIFKTEDVKRARLHGVSSMDQDVQSEYEQVVDFISAEPDIQTFVLKADDHSTLISVPERINSQPKDTLLYTNVKHLVKEEEALCDDYSPMWQYEEEMDHTDNSIPNKSKIEFLLAGILDKLEENNQKKEKLMLSIEENNKLLRIQNGLLMRRFSQGKTDRQWHEVKLVFDDKDEVTATVDLPTLKKIQKGDKETIHKIKEEIKYKSDSIAHEIPDDTPSISVCMDDPQPWQACTTINEGVMQSSDQWPHQAVVELIYLYKEKKPLFDDPSIKKMEVWRQMAQDLTCKGYCYTGEGVHSKMRALKFRFKSIRRIKSKKSSTVKKKWRYYDMLSEVISDEGESNNFPSQCQNEASIEHLSLSPIPDKATLKVECGVQSEQWTHAAVVKLIHLYGERKELFHNPAIKKMELWHQIALQLALLGHQFTSESCYNKMRALKFRYKRMFDTVSKTGKNQRKWRYFDHMTEIMASEITTPSFYVPPTEEEVLVDQWTNEHVLRLIDLYYGRKELFTSPAIKKMNIWKQIAREMSAHSECPFTWEGCHSKMRALKFRYKKVWRYSSSSSTLGKERKKWEFFEPMEKIMAIDSVVIPICFATTFPKTKNET